METAISSRIVRRLIPTNMRGTAHWPQGVVSFTFDDFPKSALIAGGAVLERHGVRGTYYTACSLAGRSDDPWPLFDADDLHEAHERGHEIGCHTNTHLDCAAANSRLLRAEIRANAKSLAPIVGQYGLASFAYPFGRTSKVARRLLSNRFASCRGIQPGINAGVPDYAELRANKIYMSLFDKEKIKELIERNRSVGGWLIFYTHDVSDLPSPYGCTEAQLECVVAYAAARSTVLRMRDVVSALAPHRVIGG
jgi:peptidoglycan/xylan/chitin deacetylase (PgdA/CDA1 family)